jgi:hypothetical protein
MHNYIMDGEIHWIDENYAYIIKEVGEMLLIAYEENGEPSDFTNIYEDFLRKYANYLYEVDKEKCINMMMERLSQWGLHGPNLPEDVQMVFRPSYMLDSVESKSTMALKFERSDNDDSFFGEHENH